MLIHWRVVTRCHYVFLKTMVNGSRLTTQKFSCVKGASTLTPKEHMIRNDFVKKKLMNIYLYDIYICMYIIYIAVFVFSCTNTYYKFKQFYIYIYMIYLICMPPHKAP